MKFGFKEGVQLLMAGIVGFVAPACSKAQEMPLAIPEYDILEPEVLCAGLEGTHSLRAQDTNPDPDVLDLAICPSSTMVGGRIEASFVGGNGLPVEKFALVEQSPTLIYFSFAGVDPRYFLSVVYSLPGGEEVENGCVPSSDGGGKWDCERKPLGGSV